MALKTSSGVVNDSSACIRSHSAQDDSSDKESLRALVQPVARNFVSLSNELNRADPPNEARHGFETAIDEGQQQQRSTTTKLWKASTAPNPEGHRTWHTGLEPVMCHPACITSQGASPNDKYRPVIRKLRRVFSAPSALGRQTSISSAQASQYSGFYANHASYTPYLSPSDRTAPSNLLHIVYRMDGSLPTLVAVLDYCPFCTRRSPHSGVQKALNEGMSQTYTSKVVSSDRLLPSLQAWSLRDIGRTSTAQAGLAQTKDLAELNNTRSSLADTAITHTNVHWAAISPNPPTTLPFGDEGLHNITSQVVESGKSVYRVVWDEANICRRPNDSSASSYNTDDSSSDDEGYPAYTRRDSPWVGLDRVNTKLAAWSWKGAPHTLQELEEDSDDECEGSGNRNGPCSNVPPNSERPSEVSSRLPSRPPSDRVKFGPALPTGPDSDGGDFSGQLESLRSQDEGRDVKMAYTSGTQFVDIKIEGRSRVFSNLPLMETYFAGHRDSVAMARRRLRKRLCKPSAARDIPRSQDATGGTLSPVADSSPPMERHATSFNAVVGKASLASSSPQAISRHAHIVE